MKFYRDESSVFYLLVGLAGLFLCISWILYEYSYVVGLAGAGNGDVILLNESIDSLFVQISFIVVIGALSGMLIGIYTKASSYKKSNKRKTPPPPSD